MRRSLTPLLTLFGLLSCLPLSGEDGARLLRIDHYVRVKSTVPSMAGQSSQIYVREVVQPAAVLRRTSLQDKVVLFVHGAGTPAEVAFDVQHTDYSWMAYLAEAGFDVFSMDMTGYGRSTRPAPMNDPCNLSAEQQTAVVSTPCTPSYPNAATTIASDWNDIGAVVDHLRALRKVDKVSLIGWSRGGPRAGGYASQHGEKVAKLILLSPAYRRDAPAAPPAKLPAAGIAFNTQSHEDFLANWDRQVGCPDQIDRSVSQAVWTSMLESDPVGSTWGSGVRRAPNVTTWGWNSAAAAKLQIPTLLFAPVHDKQVVPAGVRTLYEDLAARQKVFVDVACTSHNALWEKNHLLLFQASLEWLSKGSVNGKQEGSVRLGY